MAVSKTLQMPFENQGRDSTGGVLELQNQAKTSLKIMSNSAK